MEATLNLLITFTFFAPMALLVAMSVATHRTAGPALELAAIPRAARTPVPPAKRAAVANEPRYLQAA